MFNVRIRVMDEVRVRVSVGVSSGSIVKVR